MLGDVSRDIREGCVHCACQTLAMFDGTSSDMIDVSPRGFKPL